MVIRRSALPLWIHLLLLLLFAVLAVLLWMTPVLVAGYPYDIPTLLLAARNFADTGMFTLTDDLGRYLAPELLKSLSIISAADGRLSAVLFGWISRFVPFTDLVSWSLVTSVIMAASLFPWWIAVRTFFDARIAWIATIVFSLMPIYWREAVYANNYQFAIFFLFCSFAAFALLRRRPLLALAVSGLLFGFSVSCKDAFLVFVPWFIVCSILFQRGHLRLQLLTICVFGFFAALPYVTPYIGDIQKLGYPVNQNLARVWPGGEEIQNEIYLHLYPDPYTYFFDRERFEKDLLTRVETLSVLERMQYQKILLNFDVGKPGFLVSLVNGAWLFVGSIPSYFQQDTMGGLILWLFILPGIVLLWRKNKRFAIVLLGLLVSTELGIRFVLHFNREHLMDTGWVLALFAGIGMVGVSDVLSTSWKRISPPLFTMLMLLIVVGQLLQANRTRFARVYAKVLVQDTEAKAATVRALPVTSVLVTPLPSSRLEQLALLSGRTVVLFSEETIERLSEKRMLPQVFEQYGVTHVLGYSPELSRAMKQAFPSLEIIPDTNIGPRSPSVSTELRWLLHLVR